MKNRSFWESCEAVLEIALDLASYASPKDTRGPVVKTGPTAGQNRSRNKNGQWRRKRSDAGKPRT